MSATTPLRSPASASEFDEAEPLGPAPPREPAPASTFDESATRDPAELLIKEARSRARRRRLVFGAVAAAAVAVAAIAVTSSLDGGGPPRGQEAALGPPAGTTSFGMFEPLRGRIVYVAGDELRAIDPADPSSVHAVALPDELDTTFAAAGWSADGTRLALASEHTGRTLLMDADGGITPARKDLGCCAYVVDPWLSPDGTTAIGLVTAGGIQLVDLEGGDASRVIALDPPIRNLEPAYTPTHAWSPDGSRMAFTVNHYVGTDQVPHVYLVDLETGIAGELVGLGFGHIRHMTWSPDGSQLLVVAGPWRASTIPTAQNALLQPKETGLYLVDTDSPVAGSAATPQHIAQGHYVTATWSPDGEQIAALDLAPSNQRLVVMNADGSALQVLLGTAAFRFAGLAWHPIQRD